MFIKKRSTLPCCGIFFFLILFCNPNLKDNPYQKPQPPVGLKVFANSGKTFTLYYYVQNKEASFDGYNIYISKVPTGQTTPDYNCRYNITGGTPTVTHSGSDFNAGTAKTITLSYFPCDLGSRAVPFEQGLRYYFKMTAHTYYDQESLPSNEVSAVAIP